jgi:LysM repeat protein
MNSIRPLITITILVVAFAFLYVKINESPVRPPSAAGDDSGQSSTGVPPLAAVETSAAPSGVAPPWSTTETPAPAAPSVEAGANATPTAAPATTDAMPAVAEVETPPTTVPPIPEMPEVAATIQPAPAAATGIAAPIALPENIPTARYPDQPAVSDVAAQVDASASSFPQTADTATTAPPIAAPITPESVNAAAGITPEAATRPLASQPNPLRQAVQPDPTVHSAVPGAAAPTAAGIATAREATSFVENWPTIQAALDRGELASAHQMLSRWYDDPSLTPTDAERVESLLSQLAGTVVYSTEHQLAPAHVVKPGETLETIAQQYNVPWQLLAKINGILAADQVQPGQEVKVVPGPFSADVDLTRNHLTLMVDGRYAGKFGINPSTQASASEGEWVVAESLTFPAAGSVQRFLVLRQSSPALPPGPTDIFLGAVPAEHTSAERPVVGLTAADATEVADILSIGSKVTIRR